MQSSIKLSFDDYATILGEFLLHHNTNILVVNRRSAYKNNVAAAPILVPRGSLLIRYEPDTKRLFIIKQVLKEYCVSKQVTFIEMLAALNKTGAFIGEARTRLDIGTEINAPPVVALEFDADLLGISPTVSTPTDAS